MRRFAVISGLLVILGLLVLPGCLSEADQQEVDRLVERSVVLEGKLDAIVAEVKAGSIPVDTGLALVGETREVLRATKAEISRLKSTYSAREIILGFLSSIVMSLTGVRIWRGSVHKRKGVLGPAG